MLRLSDDGKSAYIRLNGVAQKDTLFIWASVLICLALVLLWVVLTQSVQLSLGAFMVFAFVCFLFNKQRQKSNQIIDICHGEIKIEHHQITHLGRAFIFDDNTTICPQDDSLLISHHRHIYRLSHFDNAQEMAVAQAILSGQAIGKRAVTIKMPTQSTQNKPSPNKA